MDTFRYRFWWFLSLRVLKLKVLPWFTAKIEPCQMQPEGELEGGFWGLSLNAWASGCSGCKVNRIELSPSADSSQPWGVFAVHNASQPHSPIHNALQLPSRSCACAHSSEKECQLCPHSCYRWLLPIDFQVLSLQVAPTGSPSRKDQM